MNINISYLAAHPDIPLPESVEVVIGTAFTAAQPETVTGWSFLGWYRDRTYNSKWIDGTTVTEDMLTDGVLNLYGKWSQGTAAGIISFAYSSNSEITTDPLPNSIEFPAGQLVRPSDLPAVPTPSAESTTITGWYIDQTADVLLTYVGIVMPAEGLTLYAKSVSSALVSVSFDYAFGFVPEKTNEYQVPATSESAFDGETLGEANVLPPIITGEEGSAVVLPTPANLFAGTPLEQRFAGWFDTDTPVEGTEPLTELTLDKDTKAYAMFVPLLPAEKIKITYKVAKIYSPDVVNGQIIPSEEILFTPEEAAALMPALPVETTQKRGEAIDLQNYSWVDEVDRGTNYTLVSPQLATDRTKKFTYTGFYSEFEGTETNKIEDTTIPNLTADRTVYIGLTLKNKLLIPSESENLDETHNIVFEPDGFADPAQVPGAGLTPPELILPQATAVEPVEIDKEFPNLVDGYDFGEPEVGNGFSYTGAYFYDENGNAVDFTPETEIKEDLVLHPKSEIIDYTRKTLVTFHVLTPDSLNAPDDLDWDHVPEQPFKGFTNPQEINIGSVLNVSEIVLPDLEDTFEIDECYTLEPAGNSWQYNSFTTKTINEATNVYIRFKSTLPLQANIIYHVDSAEGSKLIAPAFDYELAAGTDTVSGAFDLEARPADILSAEESPTNAEKTIAGYYLDSSYTTPFAAATTEVAEGGTLDVYVKTEDKTAEQIIVTVDYVPHAYTPGSTNFKFEAPCAPELPQAQLTATTYTFNTGTTGAEILAAIGNPPEHQFWRPDVHEYGNCYWYISVSDVSQTPAPFNPVGFSLSESIMLFPQFTADMSYEPMVIKRVGTDLHLSSPRDSLAAATI